MQWRVRCNYDGDSVSKQSRTPNSLGYGISSIGQHGETKLDAAFDYAFAEGTFTQSAVVIKDGKLIYEDMGILPERGPMPL